MYSLAAWLLCVPNTTQHNKKLGEGEFGMVVRCLHRHSQQDFAVKRTQPTVLDVQSMGAARFQTYSQIESQCQEVRTLLKLRNQSQQQPCNNVLQLQEFFWNPAQQELHLVTNVLGINFREWVATQDVFTERRARTAATTILRALQFVHSRGVVHRDVKEENILFRVPNDLCSLTLIDFGFAKDLGSPTGTVPCNYVLGSSGYIAPEIFLREAHGCEVDMFSFGVLLFRILSGEKPWPSSPSHATQEATLNLQYQVDSNHWNHLISRDAKTLVHKLLTFREDRVTAAEALQEPWILNHTDSILRRGPSQFAGPRAGLASHAFIETVREVPSGHSQPSSSTANPSSLTTSSGYRMGAERGTRFWIKKSVQEALTGMMGSGGYQGRVVLEREGMVMIEERRPAEAMSLPYHVTQYSRYTEFECREIFRKLVQRVQTFHTARIAHRYLHPENILIENVDGIGFNLSIRGIRYAQMTGERWPLTGRVGHSQRTTDWFAFVAPEIDSEFSHDERVDLWSLGAIFYTLLCGVGPFTGSKTTLRRNKNSGHVNFEIAQPSESAQNLVRGLLKVNPNERLSVQDVLDHEWMRLPEQELLKHDLSIAYEIFRDWGRRVGPVSRQQLTV